VKHEESYAVKLINAYPISVNQLDLDWSADGHHKLTVLFAYDYWQSSYLSDFTSSIPTTESQKLKDVNFSLLSEAQRKRTYGTVKFSRDVTEPINGKPNPLAIFAK
jgi:hypothetical protein